MNQVSGTLWPLSAHDSDMRNSAATPGEGRRPGELAPVSTCRKAVAGADTPPPEPGLAWMESRRPSCEAGWEAKWTPEQRSYAMRMQAGLGVGMHARVYSCTLALVRGGGGEAGERAKAPAACVASGGRERRVG